MVYLWSAFDSPLLFIHNRYAGWQSGASMGHVFISALLLKGFFPLRFGTVIDIFFFLLFLTLILVYRKWLSSSLYLFALGVPMLPYLTQTGGPLKFAAMTRFILLAFPVFIVMAKLCKDRLWLVPCITGLFATLLFTYSALFAQWYGIN